MPGLNPSKFLLEQRGGSLVSTLIAAGITVIISLAVASLMNSMFQQSRNLQAKLDSIEGEQAILRLLSDDISCTCIFKDLPVPTGGTINLSKINNGCLSSGDPLIEVDKKFFSSNSLRVRSIQIKRYQSVGLDSGSGDLEISFEPDGTTLVPKNISIAAISFAVRDGKLDSCLGDKSVSQLCELVGGTMSGGKCKLQTIVVNAPSETPSTGKISVSSTKSSVAVGQGFEVCWSAPNATDCRGQAGQSIGTSGCKPGSHMTPGKYNYAVTCTDQNGRSQTGSTVITVTGTGSGGVCSQDAGQTCVIPGSTNLGSIRCDGSCS